jgi:hypothetical protein
VFLTASHCTRPVASFLANNPGSVFYVTFDPVIDSTGQTGTFYTGTPHTNPLYASGGNDDPYDVAVIVLDQAPPITPAQLPTAGLLDAMKADHSLQTVLFTAVGYGTTRESMKKGWQGILDNIERRHADQGFFSLTAAWASFDMLPTGANDSGGTCYGDSGGPHFVHQDGVNRHRRRDHDHRRCSVQGARQGLSRRHGKRTGLPRAVCHAAVVFIRSKQT